MRIGWGYKILIGYLAFVIGILFLVYKANHENFDLVTDNYYEAELKYQNTIDEKNRVTELSAPPKIEHTTNSVAIQLPAEFANKNVSGEIHLYCPHDAGKDVRTTFATSNASFKYAMDRDLSGAYAIKLSWVADGKWFYDEQRIFF